MQSMPGPYKGLEVRSSAILTDQDGILNTERTDLVKAVICRNEENINEKEELEERNNEPSSQNAQQQLYMSIEQTTDHNVQEYSRPDCLTWELKRSYELQASNDMDTPRLMMGWGKLDTSQSSIYKF